MKKENGITLIALIITIIIMLILVGVTINFALNGGIINKAKESTIQTEIAMIKEQLMIKKAEIIADNMGDVPENGYGLSSISDLDGLSENTITKYNSKLVISSDGTLYYLEDKVAGEEKVYFENAEITAYQEQTPEPVTSQNQWQKWGLTSSDIQFDTRYNIVSGPMLQIVGSDAYMILGSEGTIEDSWEDPLSSENIATQIQQKTFKILNSYSVLMINDGNNDGTYDNTSVLVLNGNTATMYNIIDNISYSLEQIAALSNSDFELLASQTIDDENILGIFSTSGT